MDIHENLDTLTYDLSPKRSFFSVLDKFERLMTMWQPKNIFVYVEKIIVDDLFIKYI